MDELPTTTTPATRGATPEHPGMVSLSEAASIYVVTIKTLRRRLAAGDLHGVKVPTPTGEAWMVSPQAVAALGYEMREADEPAAPAGPAPVDPALKQAAELAKVLTDLLDRQSRALEVETERSATTQARLVETELKLGLTEMQVAELQAERDALAESVAELESRRWWQRKPRTKPH